MSTYEKIQMDNELPLKFEIIEIAKENHEIIHEHWHRSIEILVPIRGSFYIWDEGKNIKITKGEVYIVNCKNVHKIEGEKNENYKGYILQINHDFLVRCFKDIDSIYFQQIESKEVSEKLIHLLEEIEQHYKNIDEHKNVIIEAILMTIVHILLSNQKKTKYSSKILDSDKDRKRILEITKYIEKHYSENLSVNMLAEKFNFSYGHFARLFKKNLNMTVKEYITNIRINKCKEELLNTDHTIIDIALENGFPNIQSFYKEFKDIYDMTPARFRKISQNNIKNDT